jgi:hypothetical protein
MHFDSILYFPVYMTHFFYLQNMPQNHCASYTAKVATLASADALWISHSQLISDHFLYEDSEDENSDSDKEFLGFHKREDSENSGSDFTGF